MNKGNCQFLYNQNESHEAIWLHLRCYRLKSWYNTKILTEATPGVGFMLCKPEKVSSSLLIPVIWVVGEANAAFICSLIPLIIRKLKVITVCLTKYTSFTNTRKRYIIRNKMKPVIQKEKLRTFSSLREYFSLFFTTFKRMMKLRKIPESERLSPQFREKLMIAVSAVNKCAYCSFLHTRIALEQGIPQKEINDIIKNDIKHFSSEELPGILFAQHFAETKGDVSKEALMNLTRTYGENKTWQIRAFLQSVLFGNLCCNTFLSFNKGFIGAEEKKRLRLVYIFSFPVARMIFKRSGAPE
jgi:AhpD family alkylhydroperoxidase